MTFRGYIKDGVVHFEEPISLPEGTKVDVQPVRTVRRTNGARKKQKGSSRKKASTLADLLAPVIGKAKGLPRDYSTNHDHYLYGTPKKTR